MKEIQRKEWKRKLDETRVRNTIIGGIVVCGLVFGGIYATRNIGKSSKTISKENADQKIDRMYKRIDPSSAKAVKSAVKYTDSDSDGSDLPKLKDSTITVKASTSASAEIYCSPEKSESGTDGWMADMARKFNAEGYTVSGRKISVQIRDVTSGLAMDYIRTGKYSTDAYSPSSSMWVSMLNSKGTETETVLKKTVGNVPVVLVKNSAYSKIKKKYSSVSTASIVKAVSAGDLNMGYTDPFTSSTGLNFLVTVLQRYDSKNPLSKKAQNGFSAFQKNIPLVSINTQQMRQAAKNGSLDAFVSEAQIYRTDASLKAQYKAVPFGYRHDNPLVVMKSISSEKKSIIRKFAEYLQSSEAQELAKRDGFNQYSSYKYEHKELDGSTLESAQAVYKQLKNGSEPVIGVFVSDVSGSMAGTPISSLKKTLIRSIPNISSSNYIGLVSYADDVTIDLPIRKFNLTQQSYFKGAAESMNASGGTATYDGVVVAAKMIRDQLKKTPKAKPIIFVLSDGETNSGYDLSDIDDSLKGLQIPVCTISYNQGSSSALKSLANINEGSYINAESTDVVYQIKNLLNAEM